MPSDGDFQMEARNSNQWSAQSRIRMVHQILSPLKPKAVL